MEKIEMTNVSLRDLEKLFENSMEKFIQRLKDEQKAPADWQELTLEEAAKELNCSKLTVRRRMRELKIKGLRIGKQITLQRRDLKKIRQAVEKRGDLQSQ